MSAWVAADVAIAVIGLAVLAALTVRLWGQVKALSGQVSSAAERVGQAQSELNRIAGARVTATRRDVH